MLRISEADPQMPSACCGLSFALSGWMGISSGVNNRSENISSTLFVSKGRLLSNSMGDSIPSRREKHMTRNGMTGLRQRDITSYVSGIMKFY